MMSWWSGLTGRLPRRITHVGWPRPLEPPAVARRRAAVVSGVSVVGAGLLGASLSARPGSVAFYLRSLTVAATWAAGGTASGPLHRGWIQSRDGRFHRPVATPIATGAGAFAVFYACALVARRVPLLDDALARVLTFADEGDEGLVLVAVLANGVGEEVFFRGALFSSLRDHHPVLTTTAVYALSTTTTRNPALVIAATVMGLLFGMQRRASGGIQAPLITHLTWSTLMLRHLPRLFRRGQGGLR